MTKIKQKKQMLTFLMKLGKRFHNSPDEIFLPIEEYLIENPENYNSYDLLNFLTLKLSTVKEEVTKNKTNVKEYFDMHAYTFVEAITVGVRLEDDSNIDTDFDINFIGDSDSEQKPVEDHTLQYEFLLLIASMIGSIRLAKLSLSKVPSNIFAMSAMLIAVSNNNDSLINLIQKEADIPMEKKEKTILDVLHFSCSRGNIDIVKQLLGNEKVKTNHSVMDDPDMLLYATLSGSIELIKYLVDYGFNKALQMEYAIIGAAHENYLEIIKFLHEKGADIHFNNDEAVQVAFENNNREIISYLCQHGSKIHIDPNNFDEATIKKLINL